MSSCNYTDDFNYYIAVNGVEAYYCLTLEEAKSMAIALGGVIFEAGSNKRVSS